MEGGRQPVEALSRPQPRRRFRGGKWRRKESVAATLSLSVLVLFMHFAVSTLGGYMNMNVKVDALHRQLTVINTTEVESCTSGLRWCPWFTIDEMRHGAVLVNIAVLLYMFVGLAIVCDDYFVSALDEIVVKLDLTDDVAGATFMAAGGSAPEFFTSLLGVFFLDSADVGFGTVVGSAVFNVLFVIGLCAYFSGFEVLPLTWYPLARDSSCYLISLATLTIVVNNEVVEWYEALVLATLYGGYVTIMYFDPRLRSWALKKVARVRTASVAPELAEATDEAEKPASATPKAIAPVVGEPQLHPAHLAPDWQADESETPELLRRKGSVDDEGNTNGQRKRHSASPGVAPAVAEAIAETVDEEGEEPLGKPEWPEGWRNRTVFIINAPLNYGFYFTIPDCRDKAKKRFYMGD